jgi:hypothetical protein
VYNRGGNVDLTLRFRDAVPAFSVRGRGDVLEVVLAAPAPATPVGRRASAAAHAPAARPAASESVITVGRQRRAR